MKESLRRFVPSKETRKKITRNVGLTTTALTLPVAAAIGGRFETQKAFAQTPEVNIPPQMFHIDESLYGGTGENEIEIITNRDAWAQRWLTLHMLPNGGIDYGELPEIDFNKDVVIIKDQEYQETGGATFIRSIIEDGEHIELGIESYVKSEDSPATNVVSKTSATDAIVVPWDGNFIDVHASGPIITFYGGIGILPSGRLTSSSETDSPRIVTVIPAERNPSTTDAPAPAPTPTSSR